MSICYKLLVFILGIFLFNIKLLYADIVTDGTMGQMATLVGPDFTISDKLGKQVGGNLFHSFRVFNVNMGESATFTGPTSVVNILARVTGGNASWIDGRLRSEIPNANLYLLNPSGILFGENARLDISGSFHASTADYLRLGENGRFSATLLNESVLNVAPPEAFGFLDNPAPISIQGSRLRSSDGKTLSMIGGDLRINDGILFVSSGRINLAAVMGKGEIVPTASDLEVTSIEKLGQINLSQSSAIPKQMAIANIDVSDISNLEGAGQIFIRADRFFSDKAWIFADTYGEKNGLGIDIRIDGDMHLAQGARITADNFGNGQGGNITINTKNLLFSGLNTDDPHFENSFSTIATNNFGSGTGGHIKILTSFLEISPGLIQAATADSGKGGSIYLDVESLKLHDHGLINSSTSTTGQAGNIIINAKNNISVSNLSSISAGAGDNSSGNAGNIDLKTQHLRLKNRGGIIGFSKGSGNAGLINVTTDTASFSHRSGITTESIQAGGGNINFQVRDRLYLADNSRITAQAQGIEPHHSGGNLMLSKPQFLVLNNSLLLANAYAGNGGNIKIIAEHFLQSNDSLIDASSELGIDGNIEIISVEEEMIENFTILPTTFFDASQLLPKRCAARSGTDVSRFAITGSNILPETPRGLKIHVPFQFLTTLPNEISESNQPILNSQTSGLLIGCRYL